MDTPAPSFTARGALILSLLAGCLAACAAPPDASQPNTAALNGAAYTLGVADTPMAYLQEIESGMAVDVLGQLLYPLKMPSGLPRPGLQITFEPGRVAVGQDIAFGSGHPDSGVSLEYYPLFNPKAGEGLLLAYTPRAEGGGQIRFEMIELRDGGRVAGVLTNATLYGAYEYFDTLELVEPESPLKLELWNFAFDVTFQPYP